MPNSATCSDRITTEIAQSPDGRMITVIFGISCLIIKRILECINVYSSYAIAKRQVTKYDINVLIAINCKLQCRQ